MQSPNDGLNSFSSSNSSTREQPYLAIARSFSKRAQGPTGGRDSSYTSEVRIKSSSISSSHSGGALRCDDPRVAPPEHELNELNELSQKPTDPRPDFAEDSRLWGYLLRHAGLADDADAPTGAYGALHGVRCCGARLEWQQNASLRIVPGAEYLGAWEDDRQTWLLSHRDAIAGWLDAIAHVEGEVHARRTRRVERQAA